MGTDGFNSASNSHPIKAGSPETDQPLVLVLCIFRKHLRCCMAVSGLRVTLRLRERWFRKPVTYVMFALVWAGILGVEKAAKVVSKCYAVEVS
ncbi:MAG: hypothetical protein JZU55_02790 [Afipia sp.]|nr:hypothetical protein [Afipia sp.]